MKARKVPQGKKSPGSQMSQEIPLSETALEAKFLRRFKRKTGLKIETCWETTRHCEGKWLDNTTARKGKNYHFSRYCYEIGSMFMTTHQWRHCDRCTYNHLSAGHSPGSLEGCKDWRGTRWYPPRSALLQSLEDRGSCSPRSGQCTALHWSSGELLTLKCSHQHSPHRNGLSTQEKVTAWRYSATAAFSTLLIKF